MKKYFVIGNPIEHSMSPKLHNYWIKKNNLDAVYDKKKLNENDIRGIITEVKNGKIDGINVTLPFKKSVTHFLDRLTPLANKTQSVNTIFKKDNQVIGDNTDIGGFELAIKQIKYDVKNKKVFILGAGGVVPSIILALKRLGVSKIFLSNRTREKAENLKKNYSDLEIIDWGQSPNFDLIINATSLGLKDDDQIELNYNELGSNKLFYDVIYNSDETNFLTKGRELGNKIANGKMMFIYQAQLAFNVWHNILPKIDSETIKLLNV
jgi:shikimate dehydrogenase|tara:strand:- start:517 stop:1311 length:795 start_codon:yes stop_codon:yes gene_type:complete